jgi:signal transduction histidine kinase/HAMP domain-containing protein
VARLTLVRRSIRVRILAAFVLSVTAMAGALGYGISQLREVGRGIEAVNSGFLPLAEVGVELQSIVRQMDRDHDRFARQSPRPIAGRRANATLYRASLHEAVARGRLAAVQAERAVTHWDDRTAIAETVKTLELIEQQATLYEQAVGQWTAAQQAGDATESDRLLADLDRRRQALTASSGQAAALVEGQVLRISQRTARAQDQAMVVSGALAVLALLLSGLLAFVTLVALRPIGQLTAQVQRIAAGELDTRIDLQTKDEMGVLAAEFNAMADAVEERDQRLRGVLDTISAGLVLAEKGQVAMANPAAEALWQVHPGDSLPAWLGALEPGHHEAHPHAGRLYTLEVAPFGAEGTLMVGEDVTERVQVRERLARSERLALVGQMLAQITHEVRNPLNAMSLNAELLAEEISGQEPRAMLATITGEIRRLELLTARYLDLSRRRQPNISPADPLALTRRALEVEEEVLKRAGVTATVSGSESAVVSLDAEALSRALRNLVRNAVEAGAKHIDIHVLQQPEEVRLTVTDDGPGLPQAQADQVFEPFFTTKAKGTGLGLAISRQELEEIGGQLLCAQADTGGAVFTMVLPLA